MNRKDFLLGCIDFKQSISNHQNNYVVSQDDNEKILVVLFLRGGYDGLNFIAPVDDNDYIAARPANLRITDSGTYKGIKLDNSFEGLDFRINNHCAPLVELYKSGDLGFVHSCGLSNGTRSHFVAQELIEKGTLTDKSVKTGWLTRFLKTSPNSLNTFSIDSSMPDSLLNADNVFSVSNEKDLQLHWSDATSEILNKYYNNVGYVEEKGAKALKIITELNEKYIKQGSKTQYQQKKGKQNNLGKLQRDLNVLEQMIKMDIGLKTATLNMGGWDTHDNQEGRYVENIKQLSSAVSEFYNNMSVYHNKMTIVVMSEFGRRLKANNNGGTDHGYGNIMWALGADVKGGKLYGTWPGLSNEQLNKGLDLEITTDYRQVLSEIISKNKNINATYLFPDFKTEGKKIGIV